MKTTQKGMVGVEGLLVAIIVLLIGFIGYYVWHSQQQTTKTLNSAQSKSASSAAQKSSSANNSQQYLTITEWGVRAPYNGSLYLSYVIGSGNDSNSATFSSKELTAADVSCLSRGGSIIRGMGTKEATSFNYDDGTTYAQYAATLDKGTYAHIGDYYYFFQHDQAACGTNPDTTLTLQQQTNSAVQALVPNLQATAQ